MEVCILTGWIFWREKEKKKLSHKMAVQLESFIGNKAVT